MKQHKRNEKCGLCKLIITNANRKYSYSDDYCLSCWNFLEEAKEFIDAFRNIYRKKQEFKDCFLFGTFDKDKLGTFAEIKYKTIQFEEKLLNQKYQKLANKQHIKEWFNWRFGWNDPTPRSERFEWEYVYNYLNIKGLDHLLVFDNFTTQEKGEKNDDMSKSKL